MIGKTLAHYEITAPLGKGGMGEVYCARDSKLGREVAIKVLPTEMSGDPERLARFEREARTLATLQHANIASIYGFENDNGTRFLVMELAEGEDLSERLERGPVPVDEAVDIALQLAEGLTAAHAVGITHRDLKPANIKISPDGEVKILDFGLARAYVEDDASSIENSPTITAAMTQAGVILGTAAYMSPEQARGKRVDHRADVWAFGVVFMEMLTGKRVFEGETVSDTLAGVLRADLPWDDIPGTTPPTVRRLLTRCLDRDPSRRLQSIGEARIALDDLKAGRTDETAPQAMAAPVKRSGIERFVWMGIAVVLGGVAAMPFFKSAPEEPVVQSALMPPDGWEFDVASPFAVSPDGQQVAYVTEARPENEDESVGTHALWVRNLSEAEPRELLKARNITYPFWSPDGRWVGFFAHDKMNKVEARGGPVLPLCDYDNGRGGTWNQDGTILFQRTWSEGLMTIPAGGGTPELVTTLSKERSEVAHRWPQFLPDGRHYLYYVVSTTNTLASEYSGVYIGSLDSDESKFLLKGESRGIYADGHLIYRSGSTLMARPFDVDALEFTGDPAPVSSGVPGGAISWGGAHFGASETGLLVHLRGSVSLQSSLNWRDQDGNVVATIDEPDGYWEPSLSSDGKHIAVSIGQDVGDIWILDIERETRTRFTFDPADDRYPIWSPDDTQIVFHSARRASGEFYIRPVSTQGDPEVLYESDAQIVPTDWSADGRYIIFHKLSAEDGWNVWLFDIQEKQARPIVTGPLNQAQGQVSYDGKWIAFVSNESGRIEVYVQAFPEPKGRWMVSSDGGYESKWSRDGKKLYYFGAGTFWGADITAGSSFSFGMPKKLFVTNMRPGQGNSFCVSLDGQQVLVNELPSAGPGDMAARMIQNWPASLER